MSLQMSVILIVQYMAMDLITLLNTVVFQKNSLC